MDGIYEYFKHCSGVNIPLLYMCFTSMFIHGILPESMIYVVLAKTISASICSTSNYRPIVLASIVSTRFETIIYDRIAYFWLHVAISLVSRINTVRICAYMLSRKLQYNIVVWIVMYTHVFSCIQSIWSCKSYVIFKKLTKSGIPLYVVKANIVWYTTKTCMPAGRISC